VAAGRLSDQKNFAALVDAAARLVPEFPALRVVIGGEGELRPDLEAQIRARGLEEVVALPGNLEDLQDLMAAADLLAMPSRYEGLPLVLLEAMAAGLPVVGTRIPGIAEVVTDGVEGSLVAADDGGELARALGELLGDESRRRRCGEAARAKVTREYDFSRVLTRLEPIVDSARV